MTVNEITMQPDINTPLPLSFYVDQLKLTSRSNLWKWTKRGLATKRVGVRVFITQNDLQIFMNEMTEEVNR